MAWTVNEILDQAMCIKPEGEVVTMKLSEVSWAPRSKCFQPQLHLVRSPRAPLLSAFSGRKFPLAEEDLTDYSLSEVKDDGWRNYGNLLISPENGEDSGPSIYHFDGDKALVKGDGSSIKILCVDYVEK